MIKKNHEYPYNLLLAVQGEEVECPPRDLQGSVEYILFTLGYREREILHLHFRDGKSMSEIGKLLGISGERVRQLRELALKQLRYPARNKYLRLGVSGLIEALHKNYNENSAELSRIAATTDDENLRNAINRREALMREDHDQLCDVGLSTRSYTCLMKAGLRKLSDVAKLSYIELYTVRNLGRKSFEEVVNVLETNGYNVDHFREGSIR